MTAEMIPVVIFATSHVDNSFWDSITRFTEIPTIYQVTVLYNGEEKA